MPPMMSPMLLAGLVAPVSGPAEVVDAGGIDVVFDFEEVFDDEVGAVFDDEVEAVFEDEDSEVVNGEEVGWDVVEVVTLDGKSSIGVDEESVLPSLNGVLSIGAFSALGEAKSISVLAWEPQAI